VSHHFRNLLIKLSLFTVVAVIVTVSVIASLLDLKLGQPSRDYHAVFTDVTGLESGDTVRIAGVEVGKVTGVSVDHGTYQAKVGFSVASSQRLTTSSVATILFENLLGQRYLAILPCAPQPCSPSGQPLHGGATIPVSHTIPGLDLTSVFTGFQPLLAALNPTQINELTSSIIAVLQGESGAIANLLSQTAGLTTNLAQRQTVIDEVLDNLTPLLTSVNSRDSQLGQLIDALDSLVTGLANNRDQIGSAVTGLSNLTSNVSTLLTNAQPALDNDISGLQSATAELLANQSQLTSVITDLPAFLNGIDKVADSGSYLAAYVCNLTISVTGPISIKLSPTVPQSPALSLPTGAVGDQSDHTPVCSG
jgi:phospholipid/cholesterol/gamma-HCH transport system substrate-binding protein